MQAELSTPNSQPELPAPLETLLQRAPRLAWPVYFGWHLAERWGRDECPLKAAAMAFFGVLSLFPLVLAVVAILGQTVVADQNVLQQFREFIATFFPGVSGDILKEVDAVAANTNATTLGIFGVLSLLWSGRAYFDTLASVLNTIWPKATPRSFLMHQLALWSTFLGVGVLWLLSTGVTFAISAVRALNELLPDLFINRQPQLWDWLTWFTSWLLTTLMFWLLYRFLPNVQSKRRRRIVLGAALLAGVGWELAKFAFVHFLSNVARYKSTYGSIAGVMLTMMWIYIASLIILLGAEAAAAYEETCASRPGSAGCPP